MSIRTLYETDRLSITQIAAKTGEPYSRIRRTLIQAGVSLRSQSEGAALRTDAQQGKHYAQKRRAA